MLAVLFALAAAVLPFGGLYVNSLPAGADVWVDGNYIGRTPLLLDGLRAGKHAVTVTKAGWKVQEIDEEVTAGVITSTTLQLQMIQPDGADGTIEIQGAGDGSSVKVDTAPEQPLQADVPARPGVHRIVVRSKTAKFERDVIVYPDQTTHVLLRGPAEEHAGVVAPEEEYLPESAARIEGTRLVIRWGGHVATGHVGDAKFLVDGRDVVYDAPAGLVRGRLYLPLDLILTITGGKPK